MAVDVADVAEEVVLLALALDMLDCDDEDMDDDIEDMLEEAPPSNWNSVL